MGAPSSRRGGATGRGGKGRRAPIVPHINVTPLVDVVLVLLIIFMLVIPNVQNEGKPIEMIRVDDADNLVDDQEPIIVTIERGENYIVGASEHGTDSAGAVAEVLAQAKANPSLRVLLRADAQLPYEPVRTMFHELQQGGLVNIALAVGVARDAAAETAPQGEPTPWG